MQTQGDSKIPITVEQQDMFSYSAVGLIVAIAIVVLAIALVIFFLIRKKIAEAKKIPEIRQLQQDRLEEYKRKYLELLFNLQKKYREQRIIEREAYQELSILIRHFVFSVTGIKVQNYTLEEIRAVNIPNLYYLIGECYKPEFDAEGKGNIEEAIEKAGKVIEAWK